jgi:isorenieratene synthase
MGWLEVQIEKRLGGYRHPMNLVDESLPLKPQRGRKVAVVGAGLAGLSAAVTLGRRGFAVTLHEKNAYLGGKIGAWPVSLPDGSLQFVEHGFHAFFRHYYNLNAFLDSLGLRSGFREIEDYAILTLEGRRLSFKGVALTPVLNLLSLAKAGVWSLGDVIRNPRLAGLLAMVRYDPDKTFERFDGVPYQRWADAMGIPGAMRLMFNSFSRAFFASPDLMSTGELLKSFHSFFLSHDGGLLYDYPATDYEQAFLGPLRAELSRLGVEVRLGAGVESVRRAAAGFTVAGGACDAVILASDAASTRRLVEASEGLDDPAFQRQIGTLKASQGYAVLRLWADRRLAEPVPGFVITEHQEVLDSVTFYHQVSEPARRWAQDRGGVYELHCYALPPHLTSDQQIRDRLVEEFLGYFPALRGMTIVHEHLQVKRDFTALHAGLYKDRPGVETPIPNLYLAGDWVRLPRPAMLMEAACTAGLLAANAILRTAGLREQPLFSVPSKGLLA